MILVWRLILTILKSSKWRKRGRKLWRMKILIKLFLVLGRFQGMNFTSHDCVLVHLMPHPPPPCLLHLLLPLSGEEFHALVKVHRTDVHKAHNAKLKQEKLLRMREEKDAELLDVKAEQEAPTKPMGFVAREVIKKPSFSDDVKKTVLFTFRTAKCGIIYHNLLVYKFTLFQIILILRENGERSSGAPGSDDGGAPLRSLVMLRGCSSPPQRCWSQGHVSEGGG